MRAIIVNSITDQNRGDQALVWESARLLIDSSSVDSVLLCVDGDTEQQRRLNSEHTARRGYSLTRGVVRGPRFRGSSTVRYSFIGTLGLVAASLFEFVRLSGILLAARYKWVSLLLRKETRSSLENFRNADLIVYKGGGFLHAHGEFRSPYYVWQQLFYFRLALSLGKPLIVLPQSFGPFRGPTVAKQVKSVMKRCCYLSARENLSAQALDELLGAPVPVRRDLGFYLEPAPIEEVSLVEVATRGHHFPEMDFVGITARPYRFPGESGGAARLDRYLNSMAGLLDHIGRLGYLPMLVTHCSGPSTHEDDRVALREIWNRSNAPAKWVEIQGDCRQLMAFYGTLRFLVGTRFHSVVFAQALGVPSMAISYGGNKAMGIMDDLGLGDYVADISSLDTRVLVSMFDGLVEHENGLVEQLSSVNGSAGEERALLLGDIEAAIAARVLREKPAVS